MRVTPIVQNRESPHVASSPYIPTDYPLMYKVVLLAAIQI